MRRGLRENAPCALIASGACAAMAWLGLYGFGWNDYETEARPAFEALAHGHLLGFLRLAPAYGGSLIERAPFALLPGLWGGGALAVYRMVALPCLLAVAVLGVWLVSRTRAQGRSTLARAIALGVCVANPIALRALEFGHPEELLGACLCVAAVLLAARSLGRSRSLAAGRSVAGARDRQQGLGARGRRTSAAGAGARTQKAMPGRRLRDVCRGARAAGPGQLGRLRCEHSRGGRSRGQRDLQAVAAVVVLRPPQRARARTARTFTSPATGSGRRGQAPSAIR